MNNLGQTKYIVTKSQVFNAVRDVGCTSVVEGGTGMKELKSCPFCGAPAHKWSWNGGTRIDCSAWDSSDKRTHYVGIGAKTEQEAIEAWNTRAGEQE